MERTIWPVVVVLLSASPLAPQSTSDHLPPPGFRQVTSTHGSFEYALPADWKKEASNSYRGPDGSLLEQIYPAAIITTEYCASFRDMEELRATGSLDDETRVYDNGNVRGCYRMQREGRYRDVSFDFPSPHGIEDITIIMPEDRYDVARVKRIIDSVKLK